jgi:hypothetical protein
MKESSDKIGECRFKLEALHSDSLSVDLVDGVENEVRGIFGIFEVIDVLELKHDVLLEVFITDQMGKCVDKVRKDYGKRSNSPYNPLRNTVSAQGITLYHPMVPPLRASIVFDQDLWTKDDNQSLITRFSIAFHEIGHVLQQARGTGTAWIDWEYPALTHAEVLKRKAQMLRDEFQADVIAEACCKSMLKNEKGEGICLSDVMGPRYVGSAHQLLKKLYDFAKFDIQEYLVTSKGLNNLTQTSSPLIGELLTVLTHAAAFYESSNQMDVLLAALKDAPGFNQFFSEDWDSFVNALIGKDCAVAEKTIVQICNDVLFRLGLHIEDCPDGTQYVHVHDPEI